MTASAHSVATPRTAGAPIERILARALLRELERDRCKVMCGLFEAGMTHLARAVAQLDGAAHVCDASKVEDQARLMGEGGLIASAGGALIVIDEVHVFPECLRALKREVERVERQERAPGRYLLLGSATQEAAQLAVTILGSNVTRAHIGGITIADLPVVGSRPAAALPFQDVDAEQDIAVAAPNSATSEDDVWLRGGLPLSLFAGGDTASFTYLEKYIEHLPARCAMPWGVSEALLREFLVRMAMVHGGLLNPKDSTSLPPEMRPLIGHCIDLGLIRRLHPWAPKRLAQLDKQSKYYLRDTGLLHCLRNMRTLDAIRADGMFHGASCEGFCIEALHQAAPQTPLYFYRSDEKDEIDLVMQMAADEPWALEIKGGAGDAGPGFYRGVEDIGAKRMIVVRPVPERVQKSNGLEIMPLRDAIEAVRSRARIPQ